jgi:Domain of unknown function (DUF4397)
MKRFRRMSLVVAAVGLVGSTAIGAAASSTASAHSESGLRADASTRHAPTMSVYFLQGVPGEAVTVAVDGRTIKRNVEAKDIVGPVDVRPGSHMVEFTGASWAVDSTFDVQAASVDVVLHRPADRTDQPVVTVYDNDLSPIAPSKGRVIVAHTAVVPPADIRVDGTVVFSNVANGEFAPAEVAAGTLSVDIVPTGQSKPLFGPVDLPVKPQMLTRVFAIGAPTDGSMDAIVQTFPLAGTGSSAPDSVDAGSAGLVATPDADAGSRGTALGWWLAVSVAGVATVIALAARRLRAIRAR